MYIIENLYTFNIQELCTSLKIGISFENNPESQPISLVNMFSKKFSKLTSQVLGTRFCCAKLSVKSSISLRGNEHH